MARVVASIEARMRSSRLPGKVLADICGEPVLARIVARLRNCERLDDVVVATTDSVEDDPIAAWAQAASVPIYRGSERDVLNRVVEAHRGMTSDIIVEVCGDTPLLDPQVIDMAIDTFFANDCDVVSNTCRLSFPQGVDAQVFRFTDLATVERSIDDPAVREHVSLYFYENPQRFRLYHLMAPPCWRGAQYRFQLDYHEDLEFITAVYRDLLPRHGPLFSTGDVLALLARQPALAAINRHCEEKPVR